MRLSKVIGKYERKVNITKAELQDLEDTMVLFGAIYLKFGDVDIDTDIIWLFPETWKEDLVSTLEGKS